MIFCEKSRTFKAKYEKILPWKNLEIEPKGIKKKGYKIWPSINNFDESFEEVLWPITYSIFSIYYKIFKMS